MSSFKQYDPEDLALCAMQLLSPEESAPIEEFLENNLSARKELAEIRGDLAAFAMTAEQHTVPALAKTRLMKQVGREKRSVPARPATAWSDAARDGAGSAGASPNSLPSNSTSSSTAPSIGAFQRGGSDGTLLSFEQAGPRRSVAARTLPWVGWAVAAGLAVATVGLYREREGLKGTIANQQAQVAKATAGETQAREVLDEMNDQSAMRVTLTRAGALLTPTGRTTYSAQKGVLIFVANNMEPVDTFKTYELWLIPSDGQAPIPAGTFRPDAKGYASMISTSMPKGVEAKAFGITIEDRGGSKEPTPPILMTGA